MKHSGGIILTFIFRNPPMRNCFYPNFTDKELSLGKFQLPKLEVSSLTCAQQRGNAEILTSALSFLSALLILLVICKGEETSLTFIFGCAIFNACGLSLVVSNVWCVGFLLRWLLPL